MSSDLLAPSLADVVSALGLLGAEEQHVPTNSVEQRMRVPLRRKRVAYGS